MVSWAAPGAGAWRRMDRRCTTRSAPAIRPGRGFRSGRPAGLRRPAGPRTHPPGRSAQGRDDPRHGGHAGCQDPVPGIHISERGAGGPPSRHFLVILNTPDGPTVSPHGKTGVRHLAGAGRVSLTASPTSNPSSSLSTLRSAPGAAPGGPFCDGASTASRDYQDRRQHRNLSPHNSHRVDRTVPVGKDRRSPLRRIDTAASLFANPAVICSPTAWRLINNVSAMTIYGPARWRGSRRCTARGGEHQPHPQQAPPRGRAAPASSCRRPGERPHGRMPHGLPAQDQSLGERRPRRQASRRAHPPEWRTRRSSTSCSAWSGIRAAGLVARLWRHPPEGLYRPRHRCRLLANLRASRTPWAAQTLAHTHAVIGATTPSLHRRKDRHAARSTAVPAARIHDPACPPRLRAVPDEAALRRVIGGPHIMREQLDHLNAPGAQPHISVQVLPLCRRYPSGPVRTVLHSGLCQVAGVGYRRDKEGTRHSGPAGAGR